MISGRDGLLPPSPLFPYAYVLSTQYKFTLLRLPLLEKSKMAANFE